MKKLVVFSGAGMSAESGLKTFRDSDGLWENYNVMEVATPEAWRRNQKLVLNFYNQRRKQIIETSPNSAHFGLKELEEYFEVHIITQNIDDLHERAGSEKILHLHGQIRFSRSTDGSDKTYLIEGEELNQGDKCPNGHQLRPHVVWFGEQVPMLETAEPIIEQADYFVVIGSSLNVYPAALLIYHTKPHCKTYVIDPNLNDIDIKGAEIISSPATTGVEQLKKILLENINA